MTKLEWAMEASRLMREIIMADLDGRTRDRVALCIKHDDMISHPSKYITED